LPENEEPTVTGAISETLAGRKVAKDPMIRVSSEVLAMLRRVQGKHKARDEREPSYEALVDRIIAKAGGLPAVAKDLESRTSIPLESGGFVTRESGIAAHGVPSDNGVVLAEILVCQESTGSGGAWDR
jgi:hypothetical protein